MSLLNFFLSKNHEGQAANGKNRKWIILLAVGFVAGIAIIIGTKVSLPNQLEIVLEESTEKADQLPSPKEFIATLYLGNQMRRDTIKAFGDKASFGEIDEVYADKEVRLTIEGDHYVSIDTTFVFTSGSLRIGMQRDIEEYGRVRLHLWDPYMGEMVSGCKMKVGPMDVTTGSEGEVDILIPLSQQAKQYHISADIPLADSILVMPCTEDHFVCVHPSMAKSAKKTIQAELNEIIEQEARHSNRNSQASNANKTNQPQTNPESN